VTRTTACASRSTVPPVIAICGADDETPLESLDRIAARLSNSSDREATEWFQEALAAHRQFPLQLPLPPFLAGDRPVYCTSVVVVRRQIPLGSLRSHALNEEIAWPAIRRW